MQAFNFLKYAAATAVVALGFSYASADKIAFVGAGQSYAGGGDVVTLDVGSKPGIVYGAGKPVTFEIPVENSTAQIVYANGINWPTLNSKLILTPADGVVINSVTFSCHSNYGEISLTGTDLKQKPSSANSVISFTDIDKANALVFSHTSQNRFYYIEVDYTSSTSGDTGNTAEIGATFKPDPITADCEDIRIIVSGIWAEFGTEMTVGSLQVETATGIPYTTVSLSPQTDWDTWEDYYKCDFAKPLEEGNYKIIVPEGTFVRKENDEIVLKNAATTWSFTVGKAVVIDPDTGFVPSSIYPASGETIDSSESEWMIAVFFDKDVIQNPEITPYVMLGDDKYEPTEVRAITKKQINYLFDGMDKRPNGTYTFVLPAEAVSYENGEKNKDFTAKYVWKGGGKGDVEIGDCKLVAASIGDVNIMEPGTVVPNIPSEGCYLKLSVLPENVEMIGVSISDVTGKTPAEYNDPSIEAIWFNYLETKTNGVFSKEIYSIEGIKLYAGHDYVVKAELYNGNWGTGITLLSTVYSATFTGETAAFQYSPVEIVSIEPTPGSEFKIGEKMVVTYSAPVQLVAGEGKSGFGKGNAGWANFSAMSSNADKTVWTITFPNSEINAAGGPGQINPRLWGTDSNGLQLRPSEYNIPAGASETDYDVFNGGEEATSYTQVNYAGYAKCPKVEVSPLSTEELSYIDFSIVGSKELNPSYQADFPVIRNEAGEEVAFVIVDSYEDAGGHVIVTKTNSSSADAGVIGLRAPLNTVITTPGTYTLELPWNLFVVGREQSSYASAPGVFTITVSNNDPIDQLTITCEGAKNMAIKFIPADEEEETPAYYDVTLEAETSIAEVTIELPTGYDEMYYADLSIGGMKDRRVPASTIVDQYGYTKGNVLEVPTDGKTYTYSVVFGKAGEVNTDNNFIVNVKADKLTGIDQLATEAETVEYFTIDGIKVENPVKGLYIKVTDGKATKVIL
ncbi:MAG: hypothetical protein K2M31_10360 [Muribaculaceae bacterium]|nr:hypothetical protein [Muribaculaceae bacterium]